MTLSTALDCVWVSPSIQPSLCFVFDERCIGAFFGTDAQSWVNLQSHYDTEVAREAMASTIARIKRFESAQV